MLGEKEKKTTKKQKSEQNPSYLNANLAEHSAVQLLKRKMLLFITAAHSAGGTTPTHQIHYKSLHSWGTTAITKRPVPSVFNDDHMRI